MSSIIIARKFRLAVFTSALFLVLVVPSFAQTQTQPEDFNPKAVQSITLRIVQSGQLEITGSVDRTNLTMYIPQEGVQTLDVSSSHNVDWKYAQDKFGNRVVVLEWSKPSGTVAYRLDIVVKNDARLITSLPDIGSDARYLNQTASIIINDEIRQLAYSFDRTWEHVAHLTGLVYEMVDYDISTVGERYPSTWVVQNRRGVCVEHANLLTAMLRASGIPTRYVVGYAYSTVDKRLIGHTWVEVLASDGSWVPFDPTWLEGVYVDATHIKTANLLDDNQLDVLTYVGSGDVKWTRTGSGQPRRLTGDLYGDTVEVLSYTEKNITRLGISASPAGLGDFGYIRASVSPSTCMIDFVTAIPCVDQSDRDAFDIFEKNQTFFTCAPRDVYWFYRELSGKREYICPVTVFDQTGNSQTIEVEVGKSMGQRQISITGPNIVNLGEEFTLVAEAPAPFIFYSPEFGLHNKKEWTRAINRQPGTYTFYLYSSASLATKDVSVVERKTFDIVVEAPLSIKQGSAFIVNITVNNLLNSKVAEIVVEFDSQKIERPLTFAEGEEKYLQFDLTASSPGRKELVVYVVSETLSTYTTSVEVEELDIGIRRPSGNIFGVIMNFFSSIADFFANLF